MALSITDIANILFKSSVGKSSTNNARQFFEEPRDGRQFILPDQIWTEADLIPSTAPGGSDQQITGVVQRWIDLTLTAVAGVGNAFSSDDLIDAIPFNFGDGSYNYEVKDSTDAAIPFGLGDWIVDPNTGTLTFYGTVPANMPPKISFYKYVGTKGVGGSGGSLYWGDAASDFSSLPAGDITGQIRQALDTGYLYIWNGASWDLYFGGGDVVGPASSTTDAIATYADGTGKLIQDSLATIDVQGVLTTPNYVEAFDVADTGKLIRGDNSTFRNSLGTWVKYKNATPADIPEFNPTGTPDAEVSVTRSDSGTGPNGSAYSMQFVKSSLSGNMQGNGEYLDIDIPAGKRHQWLEFSYEHLTMGAQYTNGDFKIFARDFTSEAIIPVIGDSDVPALEGKASFKIFSANYTKIRVYIHVVTTDATDLRGKQFTNFALDSVDAVSIPVTERFSYSPIITGFTVTNNEAEIVVDGPTLNATGRFVIVTSASSTASLTLPRGYTLGTSAPRVVGKWWRDVGTGGALKTGDLWMANGSNIVRFANDDTGVASTPLGDFHGDSVSSTAVPIYYVINDIPITQLSQNTLQGLAVNANLGKALATKNNAQNATTTSSPLLFNSIENSIPGLTYNAGTGVFTASRYMTLSISAQVIYTASPILKYLEIRKNNSTSQGNNFVSVSADDIATPVKVEGTINLRPSDYFSINVESGSSSIAIDSGATLYRFNYVDIQEVPSSATMLMAVPDAYVQMTGFNGMGSTNTNVTRWSTIVNESKGFLTPNQSAALGDHLVVNVAGNYEVTMTQVHNDNSGFVISKNATVLTGGVVGVNYTNGLIVGGACVTNVPATITETVHLKVGDIIRGQSNGMTAYDWNKVKVKFLGWVS